MDDNATIVLIVDSDNVRRGMLACTLPAVEYQLEFASTPEAGLDLLVSIEPSVVIVGSDSRSSDLCQRIRSLPGGDDCHLILMDERYRDGDVGAREAEAAGANSFLPFPFTGELFQSKLKDREEHTTRSAAVKVAQVRSAGAEEPRPPAQDSEEERWRQFREQVDRIHEALDSVDYFKLLDLPHSASLSEIKEAYFSCAMAYHPDRFQQLADEELKTKIYEIFKRMSEAFKVLINPEARSRYDASLAGPGRQDNLRFLEQKRAPRTPEDPTVDAVTPAGKKYLRHSILAESEGRLRTSRMYLNMALQYEPDNAALQGRLDAVTRKL